MSDVLSTHLFSHEDQHVYAVIDGAACPELLEKIDEFKPEHVCLYAGELEPDMEEVAPYLIVLAPGQAFTEWLLDHLWQQSWGILALTPADIRTVRKHLRSLLLVTAPDGASLYFRYYDPRVLRSYLASIPQDQVADFFGPLEELMFDSSDTGWVLSATLDDGLSIHKFSTNA
jgi:hypothetical protein